MYSSYVKHVKNFNFYQKDLRTLTFLIMKSYVLILLVFCFFLSCKKEAQPESNTVSQEKIVQKKIDLVKILPLDKEASKEIDGWTAYQNIDDALKKYVKMTSVEIKGNAIELKQLLDSLKEKTPITVLNTPAFSARKHVFETEVLRLWDMTNIAAIQSEEFMFQMNKVIEAFNAINSKINAVYLEQSLEDDLDLEIIDQNSSTSITPEKIK